MTAPCCVACPGITRATVDLGPPTLQLGGAEAGSRSASLEEVSSSVVLLQSARAAMLYATWCVARSQGPMHDPECPLRPFTTLRNLQSCARCPAPGWLHQQPFQNMKCAFGCEPRRCGPTDQTSPVRKARGHHVSRELGLRSHALASASLARKAYNRERSCAMLAPV